MQNISEHISYNEATISNTAIRLNIDNNPDVYTLANMVYVAENCFEPLRKWYGKSIRINSFYRSPDLNSAVKGSLSSQHVKGQAIDFSAGNKTENEKLFNWCKDNLKFDQLINEYDFTWVHISLKKSQNRKQVLVIS